jgi:hypothetical protein
MSDTPTPLNFNPSYAPASVHGTSSGDFHQFKQEKRMEYWRNKNLETEVPEDHTKNEEALVLLDRKRKLEEETEKKSEKRKKKKETQKLKQKQNKLSEKIKKETNIDLNSQ